MGLNLFKRYFFILSIFSSLILISKFAYAEGNCEALAKEKSICEGDGDVQVDLQRGCMCYTAAGGSEKKCFGVGIGKDGPDMTTGGKGTIHQAQGAKYQTKSAPNSGIDNDALATGIGPNDAVGKWLHKPSNCAPIKGGERISLGCIVVPCDQWVGLRNAVQAGDRGKIDICGSKTEIKGERSVHEKDFSSKVEIEEGGHNAEGEGQTAPGQVPNFDE